MTHEISRAECQAMMRAVLRLLREWKLSGRQVEKVLGIGAQKGGAFRLPTDQTSAKELTTRLGYLLTIHSFLRRIFAKPDQAFQWMKNPNAAFGGMSALDVLITDQASGMLRVLKYLAAEVGSYDS